MRKESKRWQIGIFDELIVDNFAGGGGASTGLELALGRPVDIAINHDTSALAMHSVNHPHTRHYRESVWDIDIKAITGGRPVGAVWFSPDCKHFSKAKGGKPVEKHIRGLAWVAVKWAAVVRPRVMFLENIEEFTTWGRLGTDGRPDPQHKGETFRSFVNALRHHGYAVEWKMLRACDYGAPTSRKRFVLIARCDGLPIVFPQPTHGKVKGLKPYRPASSIIDFSLPCPSIFDRKKPLAEATMRRVSRGLDKFVIKNGKPFIIPVGYGERQGQAPRVQNVNDPLSTVVSNCKQYYVAPTISKFQQNSVGQNLDEPLDTVMAGATRFGKVDAQLAPFITEVNHKGDGFRGQSLDEPLHTITAKHGNTVTEAKLTPYIMQNNFDNVPQDVSKPLTTLTTGNHHYLVTPFLAQYHSEQTAAEVRGQKVTEPVQTVNASNRYGLAECYLTKAFGGTYNGCGADVQTPLPTVTATDHNRLNAVFLSSFYKGNGSAQAQDVNKPAPTIMGNNKTAVVSAFISKYYGGSYNGAGSAADEPLHTITAEERHAFVEVSLGQNDLGHWPEVRAMLNTYCGYDLADDQIILFDINGSLYFINDIGMRMLTPRELYDAQGFPHDYQIEFDVDGRRYSKKEQVARCGNAVPPPLAEAVARANLVDIAYPGKIATMAELNSIVAYAAGG